MWLFGFYIFENVYLLHIGDYISVMQAAFQTVPEAAGGYNLGREEKRIGKHRSNLNIVLRKKT